MKDIDKIIEYMKLKRELSIPEYLNQEDMEELESITPAKAKYIWNEITTLEMVRRFSGSDCPFCFLYEYCNTCSYGKRHIPCNYTESTWNRVLRVVVDRASWVSCARGSITKKLEDLTILLNKHLVVK